MPVTITYSEWVAKGKPTRIDGELLNVVPDTYKVGEPEPTAKTYTKTEWERAGKPKDVYVTTTGEPTPSYPTETVTTWTYKDVSYVSKEAAEAAQRKDIWGAAVERAEITAPKVSEVKVAFAPPARPVSRLPPAIPGFPAAPVVIPTEPEEPIPKPEPTPAPIFEPPVSIFMEAPGFRAPPSVTEWTYGLTYEVARGLGVPEMEAIRGAAFIAAPISAIETIPRFPIAVGELITGLRFKAWEPPTLFEPRGRVWAMGPEFKAGAVLGEIAVTRKAMKAIFEPTIPKKIEIDTFVKPVGKKKFVYAAKIKYEIPRPFLGPKITKVKAVGVTKVFVGKEKIAIGIAKIGKEKIAMAEIIIKKPKFEAFYGAIAGEKKFLGEAVGIIKKKGELAGRAIYEARGIIGKPKAAIPFREFVEVKIPKAPKVDFLPGLKPKVIPRPPIIKPVTITVAKEIRAGITLKRIAEPAIITARLAAPTIKMLKLVRAPKIGLITKPRVKPMVTTKLAVPTKIKIRAPKLAPVIKVRKIVSPKITFAPIPRFAPKVAPRFAPRIGIKVKPRIKPKITPKITPDVTPKITPKIYPKVPPMGRIPTVKFPMPKAPFAPSILKFPRARKRPRKVKRVKPRPRRKYAPSLIARFYRIRGRMPRIITGVGIRPILRRKRRKKKKKRR